MKLPWIVFPLLLITTTASAQERPYVPDELKPWVPWVAERNSEANCVLSRESRICVWPGSLRLDLNQEGGQFEYVLSLDAKALVPLPTSREAQPSNVTVSAGGRASPAQVVLQDDRPFIALERGFFTVSGTFSWKGMPRSILLPPEAAVLHVSVGGKQVAAPRVNDRGELWLGEEGAESPKEEQDTVRMEVFRRLADDVPFRITTHLVLHVSGRTRTVDLGSIFPGQSIPVNVQSRTLAWQLGPDFSLTLQLKAGEHVVQIESLLAAPPQGIQAPAINAPEWPEKEIWVWVPDEHFRSVAVSGGLPVDPERSNVPPGFRGNQAYALSKGQGLTFEQQRRGQESTGPNLLTLTRTMWLHLDGKAFSTHDLIGGTMNQGWRIEASNGLVPDQIKVDSTPQLITRGTNGRAGVETRKQTVNIEADGRIERGTAPTSAVGWDFDPQSLRVALRLPPGWTLLEAGGADGVSNSWISSWTLLSVFIIALIAIVSSRLLGLIAGLTAGLGLVLAHNQPDVPRVLWFHLLAACALLRYVPEERSALLREFLRLFYATSLGLLLLVLAAFAYNQLNIAFFPQLRGSFNETWEVLGLLFKLIESNFLVWPLLSFAIWGAVSLFRPAVSWKVFIAAIAAFMAAIFVAGTSSFSGRGPSAPVYEAAEMDMATQAQAPAPMKMLRGSEYLSRQRPEAAAGALPDMREAKQELLQVDPKSLIQTGRGLPDWRWSEVHLSWNGQVQRDQQISLYLISPAMNLLLTVLRVALLLAFAFAFVRRPGILLAVLLLSATPATPSRAEDFPSPQLLEELEQRMDRGTCKKQCASWNRMKLTLSANEMTVEGIISSLGASSVAIPGPYDQLALESVTINGAETKSLRRERGGVIRVRVPDGVSTIRAFGKVASRSVINLAFDDKPQFLELDAPGWTVDGLSSGGFVQGSLQFSRVEKANDHEAQAQLLEGNLPAWLTVSREFQLTLPWKLVTVVERSGQIERPALEHVRLYEGESVLTEGLRIEQGVVLVPFPRGVKSVRWESTLAEQPSLMLKAPAAGEKTRLSEEWKLRCSAIWRCSVRGIAPQDSILDGEHAWFWKPFPSESVEVEVSRPAGAEGTTMTLESLQYVVTPNERMLTGSLNFRVSSSRSDYLPVRLPDTAILQGLTVNGSGQNSSLKDHVLSLPITPGTTEAQISFSMPFSLGILSKIPSVDLGVAAANVHITAAIPENRWLLLCGGLSWGPVILLWPKLLFILLFAVILGRRLDPPGTAGWILLGLGLVTLPVFLIAIVVGWFLAFHYRRRHQATSDAGFNASQVALGVLTLAMLGVLYAAVQNGLLFNPDMAIFGNNSSSTSLSWYTDFAPAQLPSVWVSTLPIWIWRLVMLAWSVWLVTALLRWLRWGFKAFSEGGFWR